MKKDVPKKKRIIDSTINSIAVCGVGVSRRQGHTCLQCYPCQRRKHQGDKEAIWASWAPIIKPEDDPKPWFCSKSDWYLKPILFDLSRRMVDCQIYWFSDLFVYVSYKSNNNRESTIECCSY
ncbi:hypothetical protein NPIL_599981 [Nephila pilipes]|uniref:Uncharacterized protein n=1 Tax=Nephila pilipes TaxID=299642 RepID=A0A8X6P5W4_NEPPI|nr:hypothetical protein NPIL_599981 [Nephila pilipes]